MSELPGDVPEAADRRFAEGSFSSGLSVPDYAACLSMGLRPVGLVQGFCAMQWGWSGWGGGPYRRGMFPYAPGGGYSEMYQCPHGMVGGDHRIWGQNFEQPWIESAWIEGYGKAYSRMLAEAARLGAHGVVGLVDAIGEIADLGVIEFHLMGTAVVVEQLPPSTQTPWTTFLAGQRLAKVFEAGFAPVSLVATMVSVRVWAYCMTEYQMRGTTSMFGGLDEPVEIEQIVDARSAARDLVRRRARGQTGGDALHGVELQLDERELEAGDMVIQCELRGTRLRRVHEFDPLPLPTPTLHLS